MDNSYMQTLGQLVFTLINSGPATLCGIIRKAKGAYPSDIKLCIEELLVNNRVFENDGIYSANREGHHIVDIESKPLVESNFDHSILSHLSHPHPADYDWRFTSSTIESLIDRIVKTQDSPPTVGLFGVTTLFPFLVDKLGEDNVTLFNKSASTINALKNFGFEKGLISHDLFYPIEGTYGFDIIFLDPPWYNEYYAAFIQRAQEQLRLNGFLFLSLIPELARPNALLDRSFVKSYCKELGFSNISISEGSLEYQSPHFERHTLLQDGIDCGDWRKGDLAICKKIKDLHLPREIQIATNEPNWIEYHINGTKIKMLEGVENEPQFSYSYADVHKMLKTVSRRSPARERINFWTSDNYAFNVTNLNVLEELFNIARGHAITTEMLIQVKENLALSEEEYQKLHLLIDESNLSAKPI